jgi:hypothetical protein
MCPRWAARQWLTAGTRRAVLMAATPTSLRKRAMQRAAVSRAAAAAQRLAVRQESPRKALAVRWA